MLASPPKTAKIKRQHRTKSLKKTRHSIRSRGLNASRLNFLGLTKKRKSQSARNIQTAAIAQVASKECLNSPVTGPQSYLESSIKIASKSVLPASIHINKLEYKTSPPHLGCQHTTVQHLLEPSPILFQLNSENIEPVCKTTKKCKQLSRILRNFREDIIEDLPMPNYWQIRSLVFSCCQQFHLTENWEDSTLKILRLIVEYTATPFNAKHFFVEHNSAKPLFDSTCSDEIEHCHRFASLALHHFYRQKGYSGFQKH